MYGRWWQLETWLRSLAYVELRARDGLTWAASLPSTVEARGAADRQREYMLSPDTHAQLSYLDVVPLFDLIADNWDLFETSLLDRHVWAGRRVELESIRNRIGHCRRPHSDDLSRLEQTLRDLEPGAFRALAAFNTQSSPRRDLPDQLVRDWVNMDHQDASRLVGHAAQQYQVRFDLRYSRRPWAEGRPRETPVSGTQGYLWHARWIISEGVVDLSRFWEDGYLDSARDFIVYVCSASPGDLAVSFSAVDDPARISDAIGNCFDGLLVCHSHMADFEELYETWSQRYADLDPRVQVGTDWSILDETTTPVTIFRA